MASNSIASAETCRKSAPFRVGYSLFAQALSAPSPAFLYPLRHDPSLRSGFRLAAGWVGLTLLPDGEWRPGRLHPFIRRELTSPPPALRSGGPTRRVAGAHCCTPAPSEPCLQLVAAHGSSKPLTSVSHAWLLAPWICW